MFIVECSWTFVVCTVLESIHNIRVPMILVSPVMLGASVVSSKDEGSFPPGLDCAQAWMAVNNLKKEMVCNPR